MAQFPLLDINDIVVFFREYPELGITDADFRRPTKDKWQIVFTQLVQLLADVSPDNINQPSPEAMGKLDHPELYEESIPLVHLALVLGRLAVACGVDNCTIMDIIEPSKERLVLLCSAFINFLRFKMDRMDIYDRIKNENMALLEHRDTLRRENDELQREINGIMTSRAEKEPEVKEAQEYVRNLKEEILELREKAASLQKNTADIKTGLSEVTATQARLKERLIAAREENATLGSKIVQSPERVKGELERMQRQLEVLEQKCLARRARLQELQRKETQMKTWDQQAEEMERLVTLVEEKMNKEKEILQDIRKLKEQQAQQQERLHELVSMESHLKRQVNSKHEKLAKINMQCTGKIQELRETVTSLQREKEHLLQQQNAGEGEKQRLLEKRQELHAMDVKNEREHQEVMAAMRAKYTELLGALDAYHVNLAEHWQKVMEAVTDLEPNET